MIDTLRRMFHRQRAMFSILVLTAGVVGSVAHAGASEGRSLENTELIELFMQVCVNNLHAPSISADGLKQRGWQSKPVDDFSDIPLFSNFMIHLFKEGEAFLFVSPDESSAFFFGSADNDLNPNSKCMLSTASSQTEPIADWAHSKFGNSAYIDSTGKRFGNRLRNWRTPAFPENISVQLKIASVDIHSGVRATGKTVADTQISVMGLKH